MIFIFRLITHNGSAIHDIASAMGESWTWHTSDFCLFAIEDSDKDKNTYRVVPDYL
ncbi:hypothetical protein [Maribacter aestuarii]|uniref:hypothetical protein n=1 Tax=Maribacter aestuarii TaxID=1130723 RepID=UPI00248B153C|nr:hypothetical protein [Maribacter aestuarii]